MASNSLRILRLQNILVKSSPNRFVSTASFHLKRKVKLPQQRQIISPLVIGPFLTEPRYKEPRPVADHIYEEVEVEKPVEPKLKVILVQTVDELGVAGDVVEVDRDYGRYNLISSQAAVYYNDYNLAKVLKSLGGEQLTRSGPSSPYVNATIKKLSQELIIVTMNDRNPWTINKRHIMIAFRAAGYSIEEECIELPKTPISGPNIEEYDGKDFAVTLTINQKEKVHVRCMLQHLRQPLRNDFDTEPRYILLDEQKELLESMYAKEAKKDEDF